MPLGGLQDEQDLEDWTRRLLDRIGVRPPTPELGAAGTFKASSPSAARTANAWAKVAGTWTEDFDYSGWFDPANARYSPEVAGYYLITGGISYALLGTGNTLNGIGLSQLQKNGSLLGDLFTGSTPIQARLGGGSQARFAGIVHMDGVNDYLELASYVESDGSVNVNGTGYLAGHLIGRG